MQGTLFIGSSLPEGFVKTTNYEIGRFVSSKFANGESSLLIKTSVRRKKCTVVQSFNSETVNDDIFEVLLITEALRGSAASHIRLVLISLPYSQNSNFQVFQVFS